MSSGYTPTPGNNSQPRSHDSTPGSWATYDPPANTRPVPYTPYSRTTYQPTTEQLARDEARRHFLRRNVYLPIFIAVLVVLALLVLVLLLAFGAPLLGISESEAASFIAGLSALIIILFSIPVILLMTILPITWLAFRINRRQQRKNFPEEGPMAYRSRVQTLLWQLDSILGEAQHGVDGVSARVRKPLVALHARAAYIRRFLLGVWEKFIRSI